MLEFTTISWLNNDLWKRPNEYQAAFFEYGQEKGSRLIAAKNGLEIYKSGIGINAILIGEFKEKKHWLMIEYHAYDPHLIDSGFMQVFKITTYLNNKYKIEYEVYASQWLNNDDSGLMVDSKFADDFRNVIQNKDDNIIDHPDIIKEFIDNNERVVAYIKKHTKENNWWVSLFHKSKNDHLIICF